MAFITGLQVYLAPNSDQYEFSIVENSQNPYSLTFSITVGPTNFLNGASISYIAYDQSHENTAYSGIIELNDGGRGNFYSPLSKDLITTHYLILGIRDFQARISR